MGGIQGIGALRTPQEYPVLYFSLQQAYTSLLDDYTNAQRDPPSDVSGHDFVVR